MALRYPLSTVKTTDEELMQRFQNGDQAAFEALYRKYKTPIFSFLVRQYTTRENAKELLQDVFMRVIHKAATFRHGSRFSTWIYTIARNLAIDSARKARHRRHASLDQQIGHDGPMLKDRVPNGGPLPDRASTHIKMQKDMMEAISRLPDDQREVFLLREYHGLPFREIAEVVDAVEGTVKSRMRYALESLREALSEYSEVARALP